MKNLIKIGQGVPETGDNGTYQSPDTQTDTQTTFFIDMTFFTFLIIKIEIEQIPEFCYGSLHKVP